MTFDMLHVKGDLNFFLALISAHIERVSVSCMQDLLCWIPGCVKIIIVFLSVLITGQWTLISIPVLAKKCCINGMVQICWHNNVLNIHIDNKNTISEEFHAKFMHKRAFCSTNVVPVLSYLFRKILAFIFIEQPHFTLKIRSDRISQHSMNPLCVCVCFCGIIHILHSILKVS